MIINLNPIEHSENIETISSKLLCNLRSKNSSKINDKTPINFKPMVYLKSIEILIVLCIINESEITITHTHIHIQIFIPFCSKNEKKNSILKPKQISAIAFQCWCCSSDESDSEFCGKVLDESKLTRYEKAVNLVTCSYPQYEKGRDLITKCMIQRTSSEKNYLFDANKEIVFTFHYSTDSGNIVYSRSCVWEERDAKNDSCLSLSTPYGHRMEACETCTEDRCNYQLLADGGNGSTQFAALCQTMFISLLVVLKI